MTGSTPRPTQLQDGVVIGEGVVLDTRPATVASRLLAAFVDLLALLALAVVTFVVLGGLDVTFDARTARILFVVLLVTVTVVLPTTVETLSRGRSLGKLVAGVRIVRDDGGPITFRQAFVRALAGVGELWLTFGSVAVICSIVHPRGKRVGDVLAGTYGSRVRAAAPVRTAAVMPPQLAGWATHADVARLPDGLALAVRQFLGRATLLHPGSRVEIGHRLAAELRPFVSPPPPDGTPPEAFLSAVLAERGRRESLIELERVRREQAEAVLLRRLPHGVPDPEL
ncbi:RDD family protein [Cellulomonas wangsupingiae]|uniref:RDD family protein n=1 Tax=Cellulomonas wangsupingiae TaxID=2968085 RepID=A0ABY5K260_9CELL|nr:RDD family protein [Cellulomonas wangsupingiae]MCC2335657.1 RDD family protein [Cellulomonas wangsupingiae]UUI63894.1 RDD family protein [Cellulomonas wangsupingiae]